MRRNRITGWCRVVALVGVAALAVAACGDDDGEDAADDTATTVSEDVTTTTSAPEADGGADVDEAFCAALGADLDAIDAIVDSFETTGSAPDSLVQEAQDANDAFREATPDGLDEEASAIYEPLGELLDKLESGDGNIAEDYAAAVGSPSFTGPLGSLAQRCASFGNAG